MKYAFGIDVGGTTVKLGLFTQKAELLEKWEIPTRAEDGGSQILPDVAAAINGCIRKHKLEKKDVLGAGIGVPGPVDDDGSVNRCVNLNWGVFNLHKTLGELLELPVRAGNDANVAALGEFYDGGGKGSKSMLMVTLGTGIGGGFIWDGQILNGAHGVGCEIGHVTINRNEPERCTCGKYGCAEQYASARAVARIARKRLLRDDRPSLLSDVAFLTAKEVFDCAAKGDMLATEILADTYDVLGETIADACCLVDPELVVIGGGMSKAGQVLLDGVYPRFQHYMFHASKDTRFALATLGNDAGIWGCFRLIAGK